MSNKYPCIYYDNGKCQKFSDDHYASWCDFGQCEHITPSNGDRIRGMSDEELVKLRYSTAPIHCRQKEPTLCKKSRWINGLSPCEQCYLEWLKRPAEEDT